MICLRCGYCCRNYSVVLPDGSFHKGDSKDCKFLTWDKAKAICTIHGKSVVLEGEEYLWEETPCGRHGQIEKGNTPCRMGVYQMGKKKKVRKLLETI